MNTKPATATEAVKQCHLMVCKLAHKAVKANKFDWEDVYQYGMMGVTRAYNDYEEGSKAKFTTLAYRYAHSHIMDHYQRKAYDYYNNRDFKTATDYIEKESIDAEEVADGEQAFIDYSNAVSKMSTTDQIIMIMRYQGYSYAEISDYLNKAPGNNYTLHMVRNRQIKAAEAI